MKHKFNLTHPVKSNITHCHYIFMDAGMYNFPISKSSPYCTYMY
jgi:hypothetical protein